MSVFKRIADQLGGTLIGAEQLTGGSSATVYALDITKGTGRRRVVYRRYPETSFTGHEVRPVTGEFEVLRVLHAAGFAVAEPLLVDTDDRSLVLEWIEGTTDPPASALDDALDQMAAFLVELHNFDAGHTGLAPPELEDPREGVLPYLPSTPIGAQARELVLNTEFRPNRSVLIHGDFWPGNVLWRDGRLAAVIDWEDAQVGDPLADLACARVELLSRYGTEAMTLFSERYLTRLAERDTSVSTDSLPVWEIYVSASALSTMHLWGLDPADEARHRTAVTAFFERAVAELASELTDGR